MNQVKNKTQPPADTEPGRRGLSLSFEGKVVMGTLVMGVLPAWATATVLAVVLRRMEVPAWLPSVLVGGVCVVSLLVVTVLVRRWLVPLRAIRQAAKRLASGDRPSHVVVDGQDDMAQLANTFNRMAQTLWLSRRLMQDENVRLERKVRKRTGALRQAKLRLEEEVRDKNEFLRAVSHDLGAPLRNISGLAAMLLLKHKAELADDAVNKLERIRANVTSQVSLLDDLMELSRLRTRPGKEQAVDLNKMLAELRDSLSFDLEDKRIELSVQPGLPTIRADANRVRQVFQNLLDNAVKYMMDQPTRCVWVVHTPEAREHHFIVKDTGKGIAEVDRPFVFDVFRRATHSGTHNVAGKGVGLAGVKTIVESYGGRIWVESEPGVGSAFHFTLDRKRVAVKAVADPLPVHDVSGKSSRT
ncbi:MAG: HAMP domain-containing protein [Phycisphaera sp.]|nr:HAMP domain-containing protein [Phycisphaera sp.]